MLLLVFVLTCIWNTPKWNCWDNGWNENNDCPKNCVLSNVKAAAPGMPPIN